MAPIQPQPHMDLDLAKCFRGEQHLVSWSAVYTALCDPKTASKSAVLRQFLSDEANIDILTHPWQPWTGPSAQEKSKFETKTAPINVTPSSSDSYDVEEIKADSLWLSQQAKISEDAALRLVVLEWQGRPTSQLLSGLTQEEAVSVRDAAGLANLGASVFIPNSSIITAPSAPSDTQFDSIDQRRLRIIDIFHSTRVSVLRVSQLLITWGAAKDLRSTHGQEYRVCEDWLEQIGQIIASKQARLGSSFLNICIDGIVGVLENLRTVGPIWAVAEHTQESANDLWHAAQITELVHLLHLAIIHADVFTNRFVADSTIERWFDLMLDFSFLQDVPISSPAQEEMASIVQMLTSLLSLAILKLDVVLADVRFEEYTSWKPSTYLLNAALLENITNVFGQAKQLGPSVATVPSFAWAIITYTLHMEAGVIEKTRQHQIESNSRVAVPRITQLEEVINSLATLETSDLFDRSLPWADLGQTCAAFRVTDIVNQLATLASSVFGTPVDQVSLDRFRLLFLQLLRSALPAAVVLYTPDVIEATRTIMVGSRSFRRWTGPDSPVHADPIISLCLDDREILGTNMFDLARGRYPYEITPLLNFYSAIVRGEQIVTGEPSIIIEQLANFKTLMQRLPENFAGYNSTREEEGANFVELSQHLPQFAVQTNSSVRGTSRLLTSSAHVEQQESLVIPPGTEGQIVDDTEQPFIASWHYRHSGLEYLVRLLSTYVVGSNKVEYSTQRPALYGTVTDIVGLFADILHASLRQRSGDDAPVSSPDLLDALGIRLEGSQNDGSHDTIGIVLAILDQELLRQCREPGHDEPLELIVNCINFLQALVVIAPNRVWSWLTRGRLLESEGSGGSLASILIGTEMVLARYDFLIGCIQLFQMLVKDAVEKSVARKTPSKALTRFHDAVKVESGTSDKIMSNILLAFGQTLASVLEGSPSWKYNLVDDRLEISTGICNAFTTILEYAYATDDNPALPSKLSGIIAPLANYITDLYLSQSQNDLPTNPILIAFLSDMNVGKNGLLSRSVALWQQQTRSALRFSDILVRIALLQRRPWTYLEHQLFKATPLLARLYATSDNLKPLVLTLLDGLVRAAVRSTEEDQQGLNGASSEAKETEPPSLLGHLGPKAAKSFMSILSQLDEPFKVNQVQLSVWNLLSAVVTCKQRWFSLYLLTGNTPRETLKYQDKTGAKSSQQSKALLSRAIHTLSKLDFEKPDQDWALNTAMLEFVSSAQNNWSWAMGDLKRHEGFIQRLTTFLKWMVAQPQDAKKWEEDATRAYLNRFAALTCEVLAMYLHNARQKGEYDAVRDVVPSLTFLEDQALKSPRYNSSLHSYLKQNISTRYPGVKLDKLKRTTLYPQSFGRSFFYDTKLANTLLKFDGHWFGSNSRTGSGLASDLEKANLNLGLVESQIHLLRSWKLLATELSNSIVKNERLPKILTNVVKDSMKANAEPQLQEAWLGQLDLLRGDLAFVLLQRMVNARVKAPEARQLLPVVWNTIRVTVSDFGTVFSSDQVHYYRSLVRILYLTLQFHLDADAGEEDQAFRSSFRGSVPASHKVLAEPLSTQLLEILSETVAKGFRSLANQLHAQPDTVYPSDFALLTAILQTILSLPEMRNWHAQAALLFTNSDTIRFATSLFSWSDRLTISNNGIDDPVYGELSLLFILSLSSMQPLAEAMAVGGIFSLLNTANLTNYYRRAGGMSPFDSPPRLFSIWAKGILPLCLNILSAVGPPIAGEISAFLNQFPEQLARASNALNSRTPTRITLSLATEIHSLALISSILESNRMQGPRLGIQASDIPVLDWDKDIVKEDIEGWMARKSVLRERIVVLDETDAALFNKKLSGAGAENMLEERVLRELDAAGDCLGLGKANANGS